MKCPIKRLFLFRSVMAITIMAIAMMTADAQQWTLSARLDVNNGGLPQNTCSDIYFDNSTGFLWISTESGLVRYDGKSGQVFDMRNIDNLNTARFSKFYTTGTGQVFVFSRLGDPVFIKKNLMKITGLSSMWPLLQEHLIYDRVACWPIQTHPNGRSFLRPEISGWLYINFDSLFYASDKKVLKKWTDKNDGYTNIYKHDNNNIFLIKKSGAWEVLDSSLNTPRILRPNGILLQQGIRIFSHVGQSCPVALLGNDVYKIILKKGIPTTVFFAHLPSLPDNITALIINTNDQQIFCATNLDGLFVYQISNFYCYKVPENIRHQKPGQKKDINNTYASVLVDTNTVLTNNFTLFNLTDGSFRNFGQPSSFSSSSRMSMAYLGKNWVSFVHSPQFNVATNSLGNNQQIKNMRATYQSPNGTRWFAGMDIYIYKNDSLIKVFPFEKLPNEVRSYLSANYGFEEIAIAGETYDHRLLITDKNRFVLIDTGKMTSTTLFTMEKAVTRVPIIDSGYCWIPTYGDGIYLFDIPGKKMYKAPLDAKQYLLYTHTLAPDGKGNLLIPTNNGLFRIDRRALIDACKNSSKNIAYEYYGLENGLAGLEFNGGCVPAFNRLPNNDVLFPSQTGLIRSLAATFKEQAGYPIFLESVKTADTAYAFYDGMHFAKNERVLTWKVSFAQWGSLVTTGLSYKLDDDKNWRYLPAGEREIQLVDLSGGQHRLQVHNQNDLSGKRFVEITATFSIDKKYFETFIFWLVVVIAVLLASAFATTITTANIKRRNVLLEKKVSEKTHELNNKNQELAETLEELELSMAALSSNNSLQKKLLSLIGHDFMVPLQYISKVSSQLQVYRDRLSVATQTESISEINSTTTSLIYMGQNIVQWVKLQEGTFTLQPEYFDMAETMHGLLLLHRQLALPKHNTVTFDVQPGLLLLFDPIVARIIVHNLLINANKFTASGSVTLRCSGNDKGELAIEVNDTGAGMDANILDSLNRLKAVKPAAGTSNEMGWGFGYKLIIDLLSSCNGRLHIVSTKHVGTSVRIVIPDVF